MSKAQLAANGYSNSGERIKDFRTQEYDVIIDVTRELQKLRDDANALPQNLRASLLYMAKFVSHHSNKVLKKDGDLAILVDLNVSVLRGLKGA